MKWFNNIFDLKELHKALVRLAKLHHPDVGGSEKVMKEINMEYDEVSEKIKSGTIHEFYQSSYKQSNRNSYHNQKNKDYYNSSFHSAESFTLEELLTVAKLRNYKMGWVAINALKSAKSYEDCLKIARACHYKDGWAYYKWQEIQSKMGV